METLEHLLLHDGLLLAGILQMCCDVDALLLQQKISAVSHTKVSHFVYGMLFGLFSIFLLWLNVYI